MKKAVYIKFNNDEKVIGHWQTLGVVDKKEDYSPGKKILMRGAVKELYFLPNGEEYGVYKFGWTKNLLKRDFNDGYLFCPYETKEIDGELYMFLDTHEKSITGSENGIIVLKQTDKKHYTKNEAEA
jgi:hypothetical protein